MSTEGKPVSNIFLVYFQLSTIYGIKQFYDCKLSVSGI